MTGASIEWYPGLVGLDQMTANGQRNPIGSVQLRTPPDPCQVGVAVSFRSRRRPNGAMYELIIVAFADPAGGPGTTDYLLVPLDTALQPQIDSASAIVDPVLGGNLNLMWSALPGRIYRSNTRATWVRQPGWIRAWATSRPRTPK